MYPQDSNKTYLMLVIYERRLCSYIRTGPTQCSKVRLPDAALQVRSRPHVYAEPAGLVLGLQPDSPRG